MNALQKKLCNMLGTRWPLIQAPMAGVQLHAMAAAVTGAGALGSLPTATLSPQQLADELAQLQQALALQPAAGRPESGLTRANVNFFCHTPPQPDEARERAWRAALQPFYAEWGIDPACVPSGPGRAPFSAALADVIRPFKPAVVSFHFGLPDPALVAQVKAWGAVVMSSATTVEEALWLQDHGADVVIAQGLEAGGHRGHFLSPDLSLQLGSLALLPQVVRAVQVPVVAAGGFADATGVAAAMALGAAGVQVGTSYLLCDEATTSAIHRQALASPAARHSTLTHLMTGRPARGIVNRLMRELGPLNPAAPEFPLATAALAPLRAAAEARGLGDFTPLWAGQNASGCEAIGAAELTRRLCSGF
jgi:nitronate monooxygenase